MQELDVQPTNPTPYTPAGGSYNFNPTPGAGGLPTLSGLSRNMNPMAQQLQAQGRGDDSMLVHMTPGEVNSLRGLAQQFGGDLTMNPNTGLPEAGWLGKLLPTLIGAAGMLIPGAAPWMIAAGVGAGQTALTGDLNKGLMAGLQAFGGASLAGAAGVGGSGASAITPTTAPAEALNVGPVGSAITPQLSIPADIAAMGAGAAPAATGTAASTILQGAPSIASQAPTTLLAPGMGAPATPGFFSRFGAAASEGMKPGMLSKYAPIAAGLGSLSALSEATAPDLRKYDKDEEESTWKYEGPYMPQPRRLRPRVEGEGEISFFEESNPYPGFLTRTGDIPTGYAEGGETKREDRPSWMPEWMQGYKGKFELLGGTSPEGLPIARPVQLSQDAQRQMAEDQRIQNRYNELIRMRTDQLAPEQRKEFEGLQNRVDDATKRLNYIQQQDADFLKKHGGSFMQRLTLDDVNKQEQNDFDIIRKFADLGKARVAAGDFSQDKDFERMYEDYKAAVDRVNKPKNTDGTGVTTAGTYTGGNITPTMGGVTPGTGTGATVSQPKLSPGATASGYGAEVLKEIYTPKFTEVQDFVTAPVKPYTGGSEAFAGLDALTKSFQTSPGAITASRTYTGGSPSQRIREAAKANAAAGEIDYGLRKPATTGTGAGAGTGTGADVNPYLNPNFTSNFFDQFWANYANNAITGGGTGGANANVNAANYINPYANMYANPDVNPYANPNVNPYANPYASEVFTGEISGGGGRGREVNDSIQMNAKGGSIHMDDGAFVVDARTVSELGNGSSSAGQELLARLGGRPVKGPGDGVSDSIPANIGGTQEARVARDEVIIPAAAVRKLGGAKKLYALMEKAHKARKKAKRGEDTKVAKGLGALA